MPESSAEGKLQICRFYSVLAMAGVVRRCLDIGPGKGTYARLLRPFAAQVEFEAVEAFSPYVEMYGLHSIYGRVHVADARLVDYGRLGRFDMAFCGDVLEHMTKEDAVDLAGRLLRVADVLVISLPIVHFPQEATWGNPFEAHVKDDWSHAEMLATFPAIIGSWTGETLGVYILSESGMASLLCRTAWDQALAT